MFATQRHFIDCLRSGAEFETSGSEYLKTLQLVEDAYQSAGDIVPITASDNHHADSASAPSARSLAPGQPTPGANKRTSQRRIIDLTQTLQNEIRGVDISPAMTIERDGWNASTLSLYSHCATHMDAPKHFLGDSGATIDQQALDVCCGPARVVNLVPVTPRELLTADRVQNALDNNLQPGERLLLRTDWGDQLGTDAYRDELPRFSACLCDWLISHQVALVGVEAPSVADVNNLPEVTAIHRQLFEGGVVIVEGLINLRTISQPVVQFIALPLPVHRGDGSPVRAIAIEE